MGSAGAAKSHLDLGQPGLRRDQLGDLARQRHQVHFLQIAHPPDARNPGTFSPRGPGGGLPSREYRSRRPVLRPAAPRRARSSSSRSEIAFRGFLISCATPPVMRLMAARREATSSCEAMRSSSRSTCAGAARGVLARAAKLLAQQVQLAFDGARIPWLPVIGSPSSIRLLAARACPARCDRWSCSMRFSGRSTRWLPAS